MPHPTKRLHVLVIYVLLDVTSWAQQPLLRNFSPQQWGGGTQTWAMHHLPNGTMLFANNEGMLSFDGDKWSRYMVPNHTSVRALLPDEKSARIYVGAYNEFGYFFADEGSQSLTYHSLTQLLPEESRNFGDVWNILDCGDELVFQCKKALLAYDKRSNAISLTPCDDRIGTTARVRSDVLVACKSGIYRFSARRLKPAAGTELLVGKSVVAMVQLSDDTVGFVTSGGDLFRWDGHATKPWVLDITPFLKQNQPFCASISGDILAIGTVRGGLVARNLSTGATSYANSETGMRNNTVLSVMFDKTGNIWTGLDNGISYVFLSAPYRVLQSNGSNIGTGYCSCLKDGHLYLGTNQGLYVMPYDDAASGSSPDHPSFRKVGGVDGQIWCLRDIGGSLLCGADNGAYVVSGNHAARLQGADGTWSFTALRHHEGIILASDYNGFYLLRQDGNVPRFMRRLEGYHEVSGTLIEDEDGTIWMSHWLNGIYRLVVDDDLMSIRVVELFNKDNGLPANENNTVCKIDGNIIISTAEGFYMYDPRTNRLEPQKELNRAFNTCGTGMFMAQTPAGDLWAYKGGFIALSRCGTLGWETDSLSYSVLLDDLQIGLGHICNISGETTIFNCNNGFFMVYSSHGNAATGNALLFRSIRSTTPKDTLLYAETLLTTGQRRLSVSHANNSLRIEFVMPEFQREGAVTYSCFLENHDGRWSDEQPTTYKEYTRLPKGTYTFHVKARNTITGEENERRIEITVRPAWYETSVALTAYVLLIVCATVLSFVCLKHRADRRMLRERRENERWMREQKLRFEREKEKKEMEIVSLKNGQLEHELKLKASQLADSTVNLIRKNDMLQAIDSSMEELSESVRREDGKAATTRRIMAIRRDIRMHMSDDDNWAKFEEIFNLVYDNFMKKLLSRFPDLKTNERRLCAYLKMGLSSKEIASLLNTSTRSVETARYRLRKKMELSNYESLTDFFRSMGSDGMSENPT